MDNPVYPPDPILIVEDDPSMLKAYAIYLESHGFTHVRIIDNGTDAVRWLEENEPSVVLLDLLIPGLPGNDLFAEVHRSRPETPVIVLTGWIDLENGFASVREQAFDFLVKPVDEPRLLQTLKAALAARYPL